MYCPHVKGVAEAKKTVPTPLEPISPHSYFIPVSHTVLFASVLLPSRAASSGESVGEGASVGNATGDAGPSVGAAGEATGSGEEVGLADEDVGAGEVTSSCTAPAGPAVVDEHPATAAVTSTNPTVSSFRLVRIAHPFHDGDAIHPASIGGAITRNGSRIRENVYEAMADPGRHRGLERYKAG